VTPLSPASDSGVDMEGAARSMTHEQGGRERGGWSRRQLLIGSAAGVLAAGGGWSTAAQAADNTSPIPTLPGEISRTATRFTRDAKLPYECIDVSISGDRARLFVPHSAVPKSKTAVGVLWVFHSNGSTYTSLDGAHLYSGELAAERGAVVICPNYGGSLWTTNASIQYQKNATAYVTAVWKVGLSFLRANSGGGPLMTYSYGTKLIPALRGMYLANAAYDMEDLYDRDERVRTTYKFDRAAAVATNPARLPQSSWTGARLKTLVSAADPLVPPAAHGVALADMARPVAAEVIVQWHQYGHTVPGWSSKDMITTFEGWY